MKIVASSTFTKLESTKYLKIKKLKILKNPNNKVNLKFQYQWGQNIVKGAKKGSNVKCCHKKLEFFFAI
jgi:hypothetical protein